VLERVLAGEPHPSVNAFLLNAAAAVVIVEDIAPQAATIRVKESLASGAPLRLLERFRAVTQEKSEKKRKNSAAEPPAG
jgi:anthranilate phosphoribosyltransferase